MRSVEEIKSDIQLLEHKRKSTRNKEAGMTKTIVALRSELFAVMREQKTSSRSACNASDVRKTHKDRRDRILRRILSGESLSEVAKSEKRSRTAIEHAVSRAMSDAGIPLGFNSIIARINRAKEVLGGVR